MKKTLAVAVVFLACTFAIPLSCAARSPHIPKVGFLGASTAQQASHLLKAFKDRLRELGYEEGKNIVVETRFADAMLERLPALAAELVDRKVDVIVAPPTVAVRAAKGATRTIPIVFALVGDPVGTGFVQSLARPGGNITGLSTINVELGAKRLELLKEVFPKTSRVGVLYNPSDSSNVLQLRQTEHAAKLIGVQLLPLAAKRPDEFEAAFARMERERTEALVVMENPANFTHRDRVVALVRKHRLPAMYALKEFVDAGGLMSYSVSYSEQFRAAAVYVDKILKGARAGDLPVEQPTRIELNLSLTAAKAQGFTFPKSMLLRADQLIR